MSKRTYAIIGTGALGGLYGGMLAKAGHDVHFLLRSDFEHVKQHGLKVDSVWGDFHLPQVHCHNDPKTLPACDVTIVALKTTNNAVLADILPHSTRGGGLVLVLQNGLDVELDSTNIVGADRVLGGCCFLCSNKVGPGHIHHMDFGRIVFGEYQSDETTQSDRAESICSDMVAAGIDCQTTDDLAMIRWRKLMWNIPFNGLSVILNASTKEIVDNPHSEALANVIIREVHTAAGICGAVVSSKMVERTMSNTKKMVPYDSSMRLDFLNGRSIEVESIFGNPLRVAKQHGAEMPNVQMLYQQLKFMDAMNTKAT